MSKVYVPNNRKEYDLSDAKRFGEAILITEGKVNVFNTPEIQSIIKLKLRDTHEQDFVLMIGSPILSVLVSAYMLLKFGKVNLLIFDAKSRLYKPRTITELEIL